MVQYYVHIGLPKTGTTSLQRGGMFNTFENVTYLGRPFVYPETRIELKELLRNEEKYNVRTVKSIKSLIDKEIKSHDKVHNKVVVSFENFALYPLQKNAPLAYTMRVLNELFGGAKIMLTVRKQDDYLLSFYHHLYVHTLSYSQKHFDKWIASFLSGRPLAGLEERYLTYSKLVDDVKRFTGKDTDLALISMERLQRGDEMQEAIGAFLGEQSIRPFSSPVFNMSSSKPGSKNLLVRQYEVWRCRFFPQVALSKMIGVSAQSLLSGFNVNNAKEKATMSQSMRHEIRLKYYEDNLVLSDTFPYVDRPDLIVKCA